MISAVSSGSVAATIVVDRRSGTSSPRARKASHGPDPDVDWRCLLGSDDGDLAQHGCSPRTTRRAARRCLPRSRASPSTLQEQRRRGRRHRAARTARASSRRSTAARSRRRRARHRSTPRPLRAGSPSASRPGRRARRRRRSVPARPAGRALEVAVRPPIGLARRSGSSKTRAWLSGYRRHTSSRNPPIVSGRPEATKSTGSKAWAGSRTAACWDPTCRHPS